jgi:hypothetical protein
MNRFSLLVLTLVALLTAACKNDFTDVVTAPPTLSQARLSLSTIGQNTQEFTEGKSGSAEINRLVSTFTWSDFELTGFYVTPNTQLQLTVTQLAGTTLPKLLIGTYSRYDAAPKPEEITLKAGANNIPGNPNGGLMWVRYGTNGIPSGKVRIDFVSGHQRVPVYIKNQTTDWAAQIDAYPSPDVVLVGDRVYQVYSRQRALSTKSQDNNYVLSKADQIMNVEDAISGLDGSAPEHQPSAVSRILMTETDIPGAYMNAHYYRTVYGPTGSSIAFTDKISSNGWGPWHELGHMHQQKSWTWSTLGEVTVNVYSLAVQRSMGATKTRLQSDNLWSKALSWLADNSVGKDFNSSSMATIGDVNFIRLAMFQQLWLAYGDNFYIQLHKQTRTERPTVSSDADKMRYFMLKACTISGHNLSNFFRKWGFKVDESVYTEIANLNLPQPAVDPSLLTDDNKGTIPVSDGVYELVSAVNDASVLSVEQGGTADATKVVLRTNSHRNSQRWQVVKIADNTYRIRPMNAPGLTLDVTGSGTDNGTQVIIYSEGAIGDDDDNEKWKITPVGDGYYRIQPLHALVSSLDVNAANSADGTKIQIWTNNDTNAQKWKLVRVN